MSGIGNKGSRKVVNWIEYLERHTVRRLLQPKRKMLTKRGYYEKKAFDGGIVSVKYDKSYVSFWLKRLIVEHLKLSKNELIKLVFDSLPEELLQMTSEILKPFETNIPGLGRTDFAGFFQFLAEESAKGRFWMVLDNPIDRILFMTDNAEPGRLVVPKQQYIGMDRLNGWRDTLEQYERLQHLLRTEKAVPSFEFDYYRKDGSFVHLQKTSYLIDGLWGTQCRASVSEGWELLRPAPEQ